MFSKKETPPPGFIRPEEFATRCGLSAPTVIGLCSKGIVTRLTSEDFPLIALDFGPLLPNYGVNGIIPKDELPRFLWKCWANDWNGNCPVNPSILRKVRGFICQHMNENGFRTRLIPSSPRVNTDPRRPKPGEYSVWELYVLYGGGEKSWSRLMKQGILRYRHLGVRIGKHFTRVALKGEVERLAKECPQKLPRPVRERLAIRGEGLVRRYGWESFCHIHENQWGKETNFGQMTIEKMELIRQVFGEIPRPYPHLPLSESIKQLTG